MRAILKAGFFWRFAGGFAIGAIGMLILQPAETTRTMADHIAMATHLSR